MSSEVAFEAKASLESLVAEDEDKGLMRRSGYGSPSPRRATRNRLFNKFFRRNKKKLNTSRVVLGKSGGILAKSIILHLIPLGICIGLIWLDRTRYFWFEDNHPAILNSLQFAAKVHELLILASLSSMVMYITRRRLIGAGGVPFGFISTSYQVSNIQILNESAFLNSFSWKQLEPSLLFLGLFMGSIALFSPLVGPASAIAFIPNPNFYRYPGAFANSTGRLLYLTGGPFSSTAPRSFTNMWPTQLSNQTLTSPYCAWNSTISDAINTRRCPAGTYDDTIEWFWDRPDFNWTKRNADVYCSVLEPSSHFTYRTITTLSNGTSGLPGKGNVTDTGIAVSSTPVETLVRSIGLLWMQLKGNNAIKSDPKLAVKEKTLRLFPSNSSKIYQPIVQTQCNYFGDSRKTNSTMPQLLGNALLSFDKSLGWHKKQDATWPVPTSAIDSVLQKSFGDNSLTEKYVMQWIAAKDVNASGQFSTAVLVSAPVMRIDAQGLYNRRVNNTRLFVPCVFTVHWMPSTFDLDPQSRLPVVTNWTDSLNSIVEAIHNSQKEEHNLPDPMALMEIDATWADVLNANKALSRVLLTALDVWEPGYPIIDPAILSPADQAPYDGQYITFLTGSLNAAVTVALANSGTSMNTFLMTTKENTENALNASHPIDVTWSISRDSGNSDTLPSDPATASKLLPPEVYELSITVERFGYGFGTRSPTATYAFAIIYIYMAVLTIYACYAVYDQLWKNPDRVQSWNKVHDIVTLAMNSTPPEELLDCGAGIADNRTWGKNVKIRANEDHTVELVFKDRPDLRLVKLKEKYG